MKFSDKFIKANDKMSSMFDFFPAPYFRKNFQLKSKPQKAEITVCGLGLYELYINGTNITKGALAPYVSNPEDVLYYDSYDISDLLREGENVVGVLLGNGFRNPYGAFAWDGMDKAKHRGPVTFALCLEADDEIILESDESFKTHPSPIQYDDMRMGYCYDSRLEIPGWDEAGFDDSKWVNSRLEKTPNGIKRLCDVEPIVVEKEIKAIDFRHYDRLPFAHYKWGEVGAPIEDSYRDDVYVYDFGINTAGVTKLKINGKPGQKIKIRHAEETVRDEFSINTTAFQRGELNSRLYREYGQVDVFICKGGEEEFIPKFKYDGFRYAYIEGLEPEQATADAVTYLVMHSDVKKRASFSCSDEVLNKLYECTINSDYSNLFYYPTDCPHREKHGWTGDGWLSSEQLLLNFATEKSLREWLFNIKLAQREDGAIPAIIPTNGWGFEWGNGAFFDSICVQLPYYLYKYTGDKEIVTENTNMIMKYLGYASSMRNEDGLAAYGLGDWADPFENERGCIASPLEFVSSVAIYDIANKAAFLFGQAGLEGESVFAAKLAAEMKESIRHSLIDLDTMTVKGDCQTSQTLGIVKGLFNDDEIEKAQKRLVEIIHRDGDINACGVYGERFLFYALADMGECELAYKIITSKNHTCYGYWIENGATSLWERWKKVDDITADNSKNHHFHGHISAWFIQKLAGLNPNPNADDISYFEISPNFISALENAEAHYDSKFGRVSVSWKRTEEGINLSVTAPKGTKGDIKAENKIIASWSADDGCGVELKI